MAVLISVAALCLILLGPVLLASTAAVAVAGMRTGPSQGNCVAARFYGVGTSRQKVYNLEVFVASEVHGIWGKAIEIPGTAVLNKHHWAGIGDLSCAAPGRCVVGGRLHRRRRQRPGVPRQQVLGNS